jgi:hypothetical protein
MANILNVSVEDLDRTFEDNLDDTKTEWYEAKIDEAARLLISKVPSIPSRIAVGSLDEETVKDLVLKAVMRVIRNVKGLTQVGEEGVNMSFNSNVSSGDLWFSKADLELVALVTRITSPPQKAKAYRINQWW